MPIILRLPILRSNIIWLYTQASEFTRMQRVWDFLGACSGIIETYYLIITKHRKLPGCEESGIFSELVVVTPQMQISEMMAWEKEFQPPLLWVPEKCKCGTFVHRRISSNMHICIREKSSISIEISATAWPDQRFHKPQSFTWIMTPPSSNHKAKGMNEIHHAIELLRLHALYVFFSSIFCKPPYFVFIVCMWGHVQHNNVMVPYLYVAHVRVLFWI